jgi:fibronectin type 3 domain-containing protein
MEVFMKKAFLTLAMMTVLFAGCEQPVNDSDPPPAPSGPSLTIKNESSYSLSNVKWSGMNFVSSGSADLPMGTAAKMDTTEDASGYIYLTRQDIGISLRTQAIWTAADSPVTIGDNTVVVEVGNETNTAALARIGLTAEIGVEYEGRSVARNDTINIGEAVVNAAKQIQITLKSTGSGNLLLAGVEPVQVAGSDDSFSAVQPARSDVTASAPLDVVITFTPPSSGAYTATVTIKSNAALGDFTFTISAAGVLAEPVVGIFNGTTEIAQNGAVHMGTIPLTLSGTVEVTVKNMGTEVLTITQGEITISGGDAAAFSFVSLPVESISAGGASTFIIRCTPLEAREYSATISIPNNDTSRNPATFLVQAAGVREYPVIELKHGEAVVAHNGTVGFGLVQAGQTKTENFSLKNTGVIPLALSGNPVIASSNAKFAITLPSNITSLPPGETISFGITYTPAGTPTDTAQITIANDSAVNPFGFTLTGGIAVPEAPEGLSASALSPSSIRISWNAVAGASSYKVYRSTSSGGSYTYIDDSSTLSYTDTGLSPGTEYYYKVSANSTGGESVLSAPAPAATQALPAPTGLSATVLSSSSIRITWSPSAEAGSYKVYRSTSSAGDYTYINDSTATSYIDTGLSPSTTYYYKVSAYGGGKESAQSAPTAAAMTVPGAPAEVTLSALPSALQVSWGAVAGASSYKVYLSTDVTPPAEPSYTGTALSTTISGLANETTYYVWVQAVNAGGDSALSERVSKTLTLSAPAGRNQRGGPIPYKYSYFMDRGGRSGGLQGIPGRK